MRVLRLAACVTAALTGLSLGAEEGSTVLSEPADSECRSGPPATLLRVTDNVRFDAKAFTPAQLQLLEKLNRADLRHLPRLPVLVAPMHWNQDEIAYSVMPLRYKRVEMLPKFLVVDLPSQVFGAYEFGTLVRWGPVSSGRRSDPTPPGLFSLNWRSRGRHSTVNPRWYMEWYFNFHNRRGLALHAYTLPGYPASHACLRLLERDARWLFGWGEPWQLDPQGSRLLRAGTPLLVDGQYEFDRSPPWHSPTGWQRCIALPAGGPLP